jgi:hypothetical protein
MGRNKNHGSTWVTLSLLALIAASAAYYFLYEKPAEPSRIQNTPPETAEGRTDTVTATTGDRIRLRGPIEDPIHKKTAGKRTFPLPKNAIDLETRQKMLVDLVAKLSAAGSGSTGKTGGAEKAPVRGSLSKEYIQESIREIVPLVKECYEMALAEDPETRGKLIVRFTIIADEEYGGLVETSELTEDSAGAGSPLLNECLRETMYALKIKAPEGGGRVTVNYPFIFKTAEPPNKAEKP